MTHTNVLLIRKLNKFENRSIFDEVMAYEKSLPIFDNPVSLLDID